MVVKLNQAIFKFRIE